jgi:hypothetical protein
VVSWAQREPVRPHIVVTAVTRRIVDHPVLGPAPARAPVTIFMGGTPVAALEGEPIAAALAAAGVRVFRRTSKRREPRQIFCGIGRCTDCVMVVDGQPNVRTCVTPVREGMRVEVQDGRGVWERARGDSSAPGDGPATGSGDGAAGVRGGDG